MTAASSPKQLTQLAMLFDEHGISRDRRADRLRLCSDHAGRRLTSSAQLTAQEAANLIGRLQQLHRGALPVVVARLVAGEEGAAAARAQAPAARDGRALHRDGEHLPSQGSRPAVVAGAAPVQPDGGAPDALQLPLGEEQAGS